MATIGSSTEPSLPESAPVKKFGAPAHRLWICERVAAPDEPHAIGFIGDIFGFSSPNGHQMKHPGRRFVPGAGSSRAENRTLGVKDFGLHKQIAEGRMQGVRGDRCQDHFRVTGNIDRAG